MGLCVSTPEVDLPRGTVGDGMTRLKTGGKVRQQAAVVVEAADSQQQADNAEAERMQQLAAERAAVLAKVRAVKQRISTLNSRRSASAANKEAYEEITRGALWDLRARQNRLPGLKNQRDVFDGRVRELRDGQLAFLAEVEQETKDMRTALKAQPQQHAKQLQVFRTTCQQDLAKHIAAQEAAVAEGVAAREKVAAEAVKIMEGKQSDAQQLLTKVAAAAKAQQQQRVKQLAEVKESADAEEKEAERAESAAVAAMAAAKKAHTAAVASFARAQGLVRMQDKLKQLQAKAAAWANMYRI